VFYACEIIQLFFVVFSVVRVVHKFDFRLVINEIPNNGDQWNECHAVSEIHVFGRIYTFFPIGRCHSLLPGNKGNCLLDSKLAILSA
jgi:hypothetical protein